MQDFSFLYPCAVAENKARGLQIGSMNVASIVGSDNGALW